MRGYDEQFECPDDTRCATCSAPLPEEVEEDTVQWHGFCTDYCKRLYGINRKRRFKRKRSLNPAFNLFRPMYELLRSELSADSPAGWDRSIYNGTPCGAWLDVQAPDTVRVGSIVEGSDAETETVVLEWPFTEDDFWEVVEQVNDEADALWYEANGEEHV